MGLINIGIIFEIIALIISIYTLKKNKKGFFKWMPLFMFFIVLGELGGSYFYHILRKPNSHIYLWINTFIYIYYSYCFYCLFSLNKWILNIIVFIASLLVFFNLFIFFFMIDYVEYKNKISLFFGIYISIISCYYLYKQFIQDNLEILLIKQSGFWIATGLLIFYAGMSTVYALHPFTSTNKLYIFGFPIHLFFAQILCVFLYSCLSIAMLLWKTPTKTSSSQ